MKLGKLVTLAGFGLALCASFEAALAQDFPTKSIDNVVFSSPGGGTDLVNRQIGAMLQKITGQQMIVANMPGGLGGTAAEYVWARAHDGYTVVGLSESASTFLVNRATTHGAKDWNYFIVAGSPGVLAVRSQSLLHTLDDLVAAAKAKPKRVSISNSGKGKLWHIKSVVTERNAGVEFQHVPYNGSSPAIIATLSGEVDAVSCALQEVSEQVRAGKMRILVMTEDKRVAAPAFKDIPALAEKYPDVQKYFPLQQWLGFAMPKDVAPAIVKSYTAAFDKAMKDPAIQKFFVDNQLESLGLSGEAALKFSVQLESNLSWLSYELGITKVDPASVGISKAAWMP